MTVTPETGRWEALAAARTRGDVGEGIASVLALLGRPDVISFAGGFPDPETFPRERISSLLQEFTAAGELSAFQYAPTRGLAGPLDAFADRLERLQGRRPADDELLITSGAIEALELIGKSFLDPGDVVVVEAPTYLGAIQAFRSFEANARRGPARRARARGRRARAAAGRRPPPEARLHDPGPPEPGRRQPRGGAARAARRAGAPLRLPDRRGRRLPRARLHRRGAAEPLEPRPGRRRPGGHDLEDVLPRRAARLGRRAGRDRRPARRCQAAHRPVRGRARAAALRGVVAPRLDRRAADAVAGALPAQGRTPAGRARALAAGRRRAGPARRAASSPG